MKEKELEFSVFELKWFPTVIEILATYFRGYNI